MAARASKFVYEIQAQYTGDQSIKQLQADLDALGKVRGYQDAARQWQELNRQFVDAKAGVRELRRELQHDPGNSGLAANLREAMREQQRLQQALGGQRARLDQARAAMRSYGLEASNAARELQRLQQSTRSQGGLIAARNLLGTRSGQDIQAEIRNLQRAYETLRRSGTAGLSELARAQQNMRARIRQLTADTNGWTAATGRLREGFAKVVLGLGMLHLGRTALDSLTQYDDAMRRVSAITGATAEQFKELDAQAQHLAATTRFSATEVAAAMQQLAAAGQTVEQIQNSIQAAMDIAAIAQMDVGEAADQLTNIMSQFGIEARNSAAVADALVAGFTGAATSMDQLANAMTYAGPVAHALGYSLEDTTAILMSLANAGYKSERAGTALRGGLTRLIRPMRMGREVLEKYSIAVFDADNNMRDFADVLEDIGRAGMTTAELIKIFGQEAGPGMIALLGQGAGAIRKFREEVNAAGGRARELADEMENGIGGAQRRLQAATDAMLRGFAAAVEPVLKPMIEALAEFFSWIAKLDPQTKQWALGVTTLVASMTALGGAMRVLSLAQFAVTMGGLGGSLATAGAQMTAAGGAAARFGGILTATVTTAGKMATFLRVGLVAALIWTTSKVVEAVQTWRSWRQAEDELQKSMERGKKYKEDLAKRFEAISKATGVTVKTIEGLRKAMDEGKLHYDEATKSWVAGAKKRQDATEQQAKAVVKAEGEALKEMAEAYTRYADEIKRIQDDIAGRQKSLTAELREMSRTGMTDADAWRDMKQEAEEYAAAAKKAAEEAKALQDAGHTAAAAEKWKQAVALADDAKSAYRNLNKEVKEGDAVIIGKAEALETAMRGVREAGELAVEILKEQQKAAHDAMRELEKDSGMAGLVAHLDDAQRKWLESWETMSGAAETAINDVRVAYEEGIEDKAEEFGIGWREAWDEFEDEGLAAAKAVDRALDHAARPRTANITVRENRRLGGLIGAPPARYARGGRLPGYGGGDRIPAMLEPGEFVIRKEAVRRFGVGVFDALNRLRLPELPDLSALVPPLPQMPAPVAAATPMGSMTLELKLPGGDSVAATVSGDDAERLARWNRRVSNTRFRR